MKFVDDGSDSVKIDLTNAYIDTQYGSYAGTNVDIKRAFNIKYGGYQVFERYIDASDEDVVGSSFFGLETPNAITIPNHFFVSGEQLTYSTPGAGTTNIGIGTTNISGIGNTTKLPETVFAIKVDANKIRLTDTAEALAAVPTDYFSITSVGIRLHTFTATDQNTKCLIAIDNYIQSPVVATARLP